MLSCRSRGCVLCSSKVLISSRRVSEAGTSPVREFPLLDQQPRAAELHQRRLRSVQSILLLRARISFRDQLVSTGSSKGVLNGRRRKKGERPKSRGYLCLYAGHRGVAKAYAKRTSGWALTFDWLHGPEQDLSDPQLQALLLESVLSGWFLGVGLAPQCSSFSIAVTPPIRSADFPQGLPDLSVSNLQKVQVGNAQAAFVARIVRAALRASVAFWCENPDRSWIWKLPAFVALAEFGGLGFWVYDCCVFEKPWQKRSRVLTNTQLASSANLCRGGHEHLILRGRSKAHGQSWTKVAESYPRKVCEILARAIEVGCPRPNCSISACVKDDSGRIGEADTPGPARRRTPRAGTLFDIDIIEAPTAKLRIQVWDVFVSWFRERLRPGTVVKLFGCPPLIALILRDYADELYRTGFPLGHYRQLLAHAQRLVPLVKPHLSVAWEMVTRWEEVQPVCHRVPIPEVMLRGLVGLAVSLNWKRWAAITAAMFYGISRPGELLRCLRSDVPWIYIKVGQPKSRRKAARVQHKKLNEPAVLKFLGKVWNGLAPGAPLYPGSPGVYRRR